VFVVGAWERPAGDEEWRVPRSEVDAAVAAAMRAWSRFYAAVMNGDVSHDGDPRLARHLANAVIKETADGAYITKDGRNSPRKIDLAVAAVVAYERAGKQADVAPLVEFV
jgi:phage terminase large subunit-like protein